MNVGALSMGACQKELVGAGQSIHSMGLVRREVHILAQRATTRSWGFLLCSYTLHIFPLQVQNKAHDRPTKHAFILGLVNLVVNISSVLSFGIHFHCPLMNENFQKSSHSGELSMVLSRRRTFHGPLMQENFPWSSHAGELSMVLSCRQIFLCSLSLENFPIFLAS